VRKVRLVVVALAVALAVPVALLVHRAVRSVGLERELRHRAVAERVFDEMERALSEFLRQEEERPFEGYTAAEPPAPFAIGYFQIAPDGAVLLYGGQGRAVPAARKAQLEGALARLGADSYRRANGPAAQLPGTTVGIASESRVPAAVPPALRDEREVSAYDALRSLNKAVAQRAERQKAKAADRAPGEKNEDDRVGRSRRADTAAASADALTLAHELPPMTGRALDGERLVLSRTIVHGAQAYRQGILVDVARLTEFLRGEALGDDALTAHASLTFSTPAAAGSPPVGDYVYQHRFADPFDDLSARLALRTLPGAGDARYVYALSAALLAAAVLGLLALHRMVAVAVAFGERRSNFAAAVSHELKTPLTAIRMYGEMLRDGIVPSETKRQEYYRHITAESERLSRLINNVLEFSRLEKGTREMALVTGSLEPVVREAVELVRPHVESEGFALRVEADGALPPVRFERDALLQVLFNLVDNAVKYARDGVERWIAVRVVPAGGGVRLAVRDSGPGVPDRHLAHVFDPFYRGERELTRRNRGTGLGLALVRGLVERMGGRVDGRNVPEGGFEVTIAFPAAPADGARG
jgi:signal transduction histidine kinase